MNERIKQFVEQAPYTTVSTEGRLFSQQDLAQFAELIVRECAELIIETGTDWVDFAPSQTGVRSEYWAMAQQIKQHFGITE